MSLIYVDPCGDTYTTTQLSKRWTVTGSPVVSTFVGRRDSSGIVLSATGDRIERAVPALATYVVGIAAKLDTLVATDLLTFREGTTDHVIIRLTPTGAIEVLRAPSTQLGITSAGVMFAGFYGYIEVVCTIDGSSGVVEVDLNSVNLLNLTSQNTQNGGTGVIDNVEIEGSTGTLTVDDIYILDTTGAAPQNDKLGDTRIDSLLPIGDGTTNDFPILFPSTPTTSFDKVDDPTPDDDGSYVASDVSESLELFDMSEVPDAGGTSAIYGVQLAIYARKDKSTARTVTPKSRSGGTTYDGTDQPLSSAYGYVFEIWQTDPDTSADWVEADLNAAEFGVGLP